LFWLFATVNKGGKMRISLSVEMGILVFYPTHSAERELVNFIIKTVSLGEKLDYDGCIEQEDDSYGVYFLIGAKKDRVSRNKGTFTLISSGLKGGRRFTLRGTTRNDEKLVRYIRDMCYFASAGIIYLGDIKTESGESAIVFTGARCVNCNAAVIGLRCECKLCNDCIREYGFNFACNPSEFSTTEKKNIQKFQYLLPSQRKFNNKIICKNAGLSEDQIKFLQDLIRN